jgi:hypothetical protein
VEWTLGVAVGLAVADFIMLALGSGPLQTGLMVGLAMSVALLIRGGVMFWTESGVSALLVAGLDPTTSGVSPDRFLEALIGGGMALAVSATFPSNASVRAKQAARPVLEDLATVLRDSAAALIGGDVKLAEGARSEARRIDAPVARLREELDGGYHIARYAPPRMRHLGRLGYYAVAADQLDLAVRNTRVLARAAVTLVRDKGAAPGGLVEAILGLAPLRWRLSPDTWNSRITRSMYASSRSRPRGQQRPCSRRATTWNPARSSPRSARRPPTCCKPPA